MLTIALLAALAFTAPAEASDGGALGAGAGSSTPSSPPPSAPELVVDLEGRTRGRRISRSEYVAEVDAHRRRAVAQVKADQGADFTSKDIDSWIARNAQPVSKVLDVAFLPSALRHRELRILGDEGVGDIVLTAIRRWVHGLTNAILSGALWDGSRSEPILSVEVDGDTIPLVLSREDGGRWFVRVHRPRTSGEPAGSCHTVIVAVVSTSYASEV